MARARFPHLLPDDAALWQRFLDKNPTRFNRIDYDVRVGTGRDPGNEYPENIRKMALDLSLRRIDAVGHTKHGLYIIEISTTPGLKAIGQLIAYPTLYRTTFRPDAPLFPLLVAAVLQSDIRPVLRQHGLTYELYPAPI